MGVIIRKCFSISSQAGKFRLILDLPHSHPSNMLVSELRAWVCHLSGFDTAFPSKVYITPKGGVSPEMHTHNITN